jgi:hypothetical protein
MQILVNLLLALFRPGRAMDILSWFASLWFLICGLLSMAADTIAKASRRMFSPALSPSLNAYAYFLVPPRKENHEVL